MAKRKMTEKQLANLQTDKYKFSKDNPEIAQKNQKKSVESRKKNQTLAERLKIALTLPNEETGEINSIAITNAIINRAAKGDVSAFQTIRDTIGEKPTDKQEIKNITPQIVVATQDDANILKRIADVKPDENIL